MAYPPSRSMNSELSEGLTDGSYKKVVADRGGAVSPKTYEARADLNDNWYGIHEKAAKVTPDGLVHSTPNYVATPATPGDIF